MNDGACERVRTSNEYGTSVKPCPSFEQVTVIRQKRRRYTLPHMAPGQAARADARARHDASPATRWRVHMAGVGGMGIGVVGAILVRAGHKEGYRVIFQDKKGLAIRNGGVYSQITFVEDDGGRQAQVDRRSRSPTHEPRQAPSPTARPTCCSASTSSKPPAPSTRASSSASPTKDRTARRAQPAQAADRLHAARQARTSTPKRSAKRSTTTAAPSTASPRTSAEICEQRLGSKQFVNIMMLGVAYPARADPGQRHSIAWAIKDTIRRDHRKNLKAFNIGRKLALEPRALPKKPEPETWQQLVTNKARILRKTQRPAAARGPTTSRGSSDGAMKQMREPARRRASTTWPCASTT